MLQFDSKLKIIGVLGVPDIGDSFFLEQLRRDLDALQEGGVDALLIENFGDEMPCNSDATISYFQGALDVIHGGIHVPFGIALLPHEYVEVFRIADRFDADFVWFDTFVDPVAPKYTPTRIEIRPNPVAISRHGTRPIYTEIQPRNFYYMLEETPIEVSAYKALVGGADSITVVRDETYRESSLTRSGELLANIALSA